jgi:hypothetical protein
VTAPSKIWGVARFFVTPGTGSLALAELVVQVLPNFRLNPAGPFYQFALTFLAASAGLTPIYDGSNYPDFLKGVGGFFPGAQAGNVHADLHEFIKAVRGGALPQVQAEQSLCCMLANAAFETVSEANEKRLTGNPVFEVFRHVRNAASHGNAWHFHAKHPKFRGQWKGIIIDETLKGSANPLHGKTCFYGTLSPADLLYLLQDVEALLV